MPILKADVAARPRFLSGVVNIAKQYAWRGQLSALGLTFHHLDHVVDDMAVFALWAEHDDLRVGVDLYVVPGWPVKQVIRIDSLLLAVCIGRGELAEQDETPMGTLAHIAFKSLKQRGGINARRETEVFAADLA